MSITNSINQLNPYYLLQSGVKQDVADRLLNGRFTKADFSQNVFLSFCPEFSSIFMSNEPSKYDFMYEFFCEHALGIFSKEDYGSAQLFCIAMYIAHNLELSLATTKNINNTANLNSENSSPTVSRDKGGTHHPRTKTNFESDYSKTAYGQRLYPFMKIIRSSRIRGVY
jgi:hypothetical protein